MKDYRFKITDRQDGMLDGTRIIVDKETGVQYLFAYFSNTGGVTVLVDKEGKPLLDPEYADKFD